LPQETLCFRRTGFPPVLSLLVPAYALVSAPPLLAGAASLRLTTLSYHWNCFQSATAARRLSPRHFRRGMARPVSCYALLKWWLLLSQHPGCHRDPTSFATERRLGGLGRRSGFFPSRARSFSPAL